MCSWTEVPSRSMSTRTDSVCLMVELSTVGGTGDRRGGRSEGAPIRGACRPALRGGRAGTVLLRWGGTVRPGAPGPGGHGGSRRGQRAGSCPARGPGEGRGGSGGRETAPVPARSGARSGLGPAGPASRHQGHGGVQNPGAVEPVGCSCPVMARRDGLTPGAAVRRCGPMAWAHPRGRCTLHGPAVVQKNSRGGAAARGPAAGTRNRHPVHRMAIPGATPGCFSPASRISGGDQWELMPPR